MISANTELLFNPNQHPSLGNIMFVVATTLALAWDNNANATFPKLQKDYDYWGDAHKKTILRNVLTDKTTVQSKYFGKTGVDSFTYEELKYDNGTELNGYFLSYKYFGKYNDRISQLFEIDDITHDYIKHKYSNIVNSTNTVSIHIRRGDLAKQVMGGNGIAYRLPISYYYNAINYMNNKLIDPLYVLFMEHEEDQYWCKKNIMRIYPQNKFIMINGEKDYVDLYLMSFCKHNIIANSTFSWWSAFLNKNNDKIIIYPKNWLDELRQNDHFPSDWTGIPFSV